MLHVYLCTMCVSSALGGQKRTLEPLELQLQKAESPQWVLEWNSGPLEELLRSLSNSSVNFL